DARADIDVQRRPGFAERARKPGGLVEIMRIERRMAGPVGEAWPQVDEAGAAVSGERAKAAPFAEKPRQPHNGGKLARVEEREHPAAGEIPEHQDASPSAGGQ